MAKYQICLLAEKFYQKYPSELFPEILSKGSSRPYLILLIEIDGKKYGIPFRSHIKHKYCFKIVKYDNASEGLDYTKAVVLEDEDIGRKAHVRPVSLPEIDKNIDIII